MHESGPVKKLMEQVLAEAAKHNTSRITAVKVKLGAGSEMSPESLRLHFEHAAENTIAEGADLTIEQVPIQYRCEACGETTESWERLVFCPKCDQPKLRAESGEEILLEAVELQPA